MGFWSDLGDAASSVASTVGDTVEGAVDAVVDTVEDGVDTVIDTVQDGIEAGTEWVCKNDGSVGCGAVNIFGGALDGLLEGGQSILDDLFDIQRAGAGVLGSLLRLDLVGALKGLGSLGLEGLSLGVKGLRFVLGGYIAGGIVKHFRRSSLMRFVEELLEERFEDDPEGLSLAREETGLDGGRFGFRLPAQHRVFVMDSDDVELWRMHRDGVIDLYAMAGLLSFSSFPLISTAHPNTVVKLVGPDGTDRAMPVNRLVLSRHISSEGRLWRLRVYAMSRQVVAKRLDTASQKLKEIGVILQWNDGERFAWFRDYTRQEITEDEYNFDTSGLEPLLEQPEYDRAPGVNCQLLALGGFELRGSSGKNGRAGARNIQECLSPIPLTDQSNCVTQTELQQDRTDLCCNTIQSCRSSGVIYKDAYPTQFFQYILPHEIGHYLGLCHCGHDGFQNVMWRPDKLDWINLGNLSYYWEDEPHFSLEDGKNAWRFIVDQMASCLTGASRPVITTSPVLEARVGRLYNYAAQATDTRNPSWCLVSGPEGLTINANTGLVDWTPEAVGNFPVQIQAINAAGPVTQAYTINVTDRPVID